MFWAIAGALAAPAGFTVSKTTEADAATGKCTIYAGPSRDGITPLRAECHWPEASIDRIDARFGDQGVHDEVFSAIAESVVERTEGGVAFVRQVHTARGITDRECRLQMTRSLAGGTLTYGWSLDPAFATPAEGRVLVAHDTGAWTFSAAPEGGVNVTYDLAYGPGGSVPGFMVRAFQGSGFEAAISELRAWVKGA
jgi:hypothetical protein